MKHWYGVVEFNQAEPFNDGPIAPSTPNTPHQSGFAPKGGSPIERLHSTELNRSSSSPSYKGGQSLGCRSSHRESHLSGAEPKSVPLKAPT